MAWNRNLQLKIVIPYVLCMVVFFGLAFYYAGHNFKVAMGWIVAGIVTSQIAIDFATFDSPKVKTRFSVPYKILSGVIALLVVYFA